MENMLSWKTRPVLLCTLSWISSVSAFGAAVYGAQPTSVPAPTAIRNFRDHVFLDKEDLRKRYGAAQLPGPILPTGVYTMQPAATYVIGQNNVINITSPLCPGYAGSTVAYPNGFHYSIACGSAITGLFNGAMGFGATWDNLGGTAYELASCVSRCDEFPGCLVAQVGSTGALTTKCYLKTALRGGTAPYSIIASANAALCLDCNPNPPVITATSSTVSGSVTSTFSTATYTTLQAGCYSMNTSSTVFETVRNLPNTSNAPQICGNLCGTKSYFGIWGSKCSCGDALPDGGAQGLAAQCDWPCPGNPSYWCGATIAGGVQQLYMNVYARRTAVPPWSSSGIQASATSSSVSGFFLLISI